MKHSFLIAQTKLGSFARWSHSIIGSSTRSWHSNVRRISSPSVNVIESWRVKQWLLGRIASSVRQPAVDIPMCAGSVHHQWTLLKVDVLSIECSLGQHSARDARMSVGGGIAADLCDNRCVEFHNWFIVFECESETVYRLVRVCYDIISCAYFLQAHRKCFHATTYWVGHQVLKLVHQ